jgi:hypothetical protein
MNNQTAQSEVSVDVLPEDRLEGNEAARRKSWGRQVSIRNTSLFSAASQIKEQEHQGAAEVARMQRADTCNLERRKSIDENSSNGAPKTGINSIHAQVIST